MGIGAQLVEFFDTTTHPPAYGLPDAHAIYTLSDFVHIHPEAVPNYSTLLRMCRRLCEAGYLANIGVSTYGPALLLGRYMAIGGFDADLAHYGVYDFVAVGFVAIREHFLSSVLPLYVRSMDDREGIGTGFLLDDQRIVTARHCIEKMREVTIPGWDAAQAPLEHIWIPDDRRDDIAVLGFASDPLPGRPGFRLADTWVLDEVLTMGYPPIAGFDSVQVAEQAHIAGHLQSSIGAVASAGTSYLSGACLLITARVKGGNSGGPVINKEGKVVAVVSGLSRDLDDPNQLDTLGYAVATQAAVVRRLLTAIVDGPNEVERLRFQSLDAGFQTA